MNPLAWIAIGISAVIIGLFILDYCQYKLSIIRDELEHRDDYSEMEIENSEVVLREATSAKFIRKPIEQFSLYSEWIAIERTIEFNPEWVKSISEHDEEELDLDKVPRILNGTIIKSITPNDNLVFICGTQLGNFIITNCHYLNDESINTNSDDIIDLVTEIKMLYDVLKYDDIISIISAWIDGPHKLSTQIDTFLKHFNTK